MQPICAHLQQYQQAGLDSTDSLDIFKPDNRRPPQTRRRTIHLHPRENERAGYNEIPQPRLRRPARLGHRRPRRPRHPHLAATAGIWENKVRYRDFQWEILESEHIELHFEPEFQNLAVRAIEYLEEGYDHISQILHHDLFAPAAGRHLSVALPVSSRPISFPTFCRLASLALPSRCASAWSFPLPATLRRVPQCPHPRADSHFQYDIVHKGPIRRITSPIVQPPTWLMEGMANTPPQAATQSMKWSCATPCSPTASSPSKPWNQVWGQGNVFLAYKQSHSLMEIHCPALRPGKNQPHPPPVGQPARHRQAHGSPDRHGFENLDERWSAQMRKTLLAPLADTRLHL